MKASIALNHADRCALCGAEADPIDFDFAFQPMVSLRRQVIFAHEALARGPHGEPASTVLSQITPSNRKRFDQDCRTLAIQRAAALDMKGSLSINFIPNAIADPKACIQRTLRVAGESGFELSRLIFEVTEGERVDDIDLLARVFNEYKSLGIRTAIDDFGAGYAGLNLLARFTPDIVKLDLDLVRDIDISPSKQIIVESVIEMSNKLGAQVLAEGVETERERDCLGALGIDLMQGFLFARPAFRNLAAVSDGAWPTG